MIDDDEVYLLKNKNLNRSHRQVGREMKWTRLYQYGSSVPGAEKTRFKSSPVWFQESFPPTTSALISVVLMSVATLVREERVGQIVLQAYT